LTVSENGTTHYAPVPEASSQPEKPRIVLVKMVESDESEEDAHLLREAMGVLLEYSGDDKVHIDIISKGKRVRLDLPNVTTAYCAKLEERLEELLGAGSVQSHLYEPETAAAE